MRLHRLRTRGVGMPFRSREVDIDFDAIGDGLVAFVGDNGAGKSHLLLLSGVGTLFREFVDYGESFQDHVAPGVRDAVSELEFSLGEERYRALVQCDPAFGGGRGRTEAYLFSDAPGGWSPLAGPLVRDFDAKLAEILPSKELFLASVFACQGGGGSFIRLAKSQRKDLFVGPLGLDHLQGQSEVARERARAVAARLERAREERASVAERLERALSLELALDDYRTKLEAHEATALLRRSEVDAANALLARARDALSRAEAEGEAATRERERLEAEKGDAQRRVTTLTVRRSEIDATLASASEVRAATARLSETEAQIAALQADERSTAEKLRPLGADVARLGAQRASLADEHRRVTASIEVARAASTRAEALSALEEEMAAHRRTLDRLTLESSDGEAREPGLEKAAHDEAEARSRRGVLEARRRELEPRRGLLTQIPGVDACATCPLTADARTAQATLDQVLAELAGLPVVDGTPAQDALRAHAESQRKLAKDRASVQAWISEHGPKIERLSADRELAATLPALKEDATRIKSEGIAVRSQLDEADQGAAFHRSALAGIQEKLTELLLAKDRLTATAGRLEAIARAEAQRAEVDEALSAARAAGMAAAAALSALPVHDTTEQATAVAGAERELAERTAMLMQAEDDVVGVRTAIARAAGERESLGDPKADLEALQVREAELTRDAADWALLEKSLGREGVQALAIDAAGPTVSALANDLLASCYGPRFSLSLETQAAKKSGGQKEVFDLRIIDAEAGREAKQGSGGEMVLLDEALRLAIAMFNTQRSGIPLRTLWRDETTGALSPENANRYVAMLRRAMELGGFERCLLVAHSQAVWEQADVRLFVSHGAVTTDDARAAA